MICPVCKSEIPDSSIICPLCNTQFAFSAPSSIQSSNTEVYEVVENKQVPEETFSPSEKVVPTEIYHGPEEEINPEAMTYFVAEKQKENDEIMHINGREIEKSEETYNPSSVVNANPLRVEVPNNGGINSGSSAMVGNQYLNNSQVVGTQVNNMAVNNNLTNNPVNGVNSQNLSLGNGNNNYNNGGVVSNTMLVNEPLQARAPAGNMMTADGVTQRPPLEASSSVVNSQNNMQQASDGPTNVGAINTVGTVNDEFVQDKEKQRSKENIFFMVVIVFGVAILLLIAVVMMINPKKNSSSSTTTREAYTHTVTPLAETKNVGGRSSFNYPMYVGNTTVASYFDQNTKAYTDVDVTGVRFITGVEAQELATYYAKEELREGFEWYGFEYKVQFNDLTYLNGSKVDPTLNAKFYKFNGCDFITYNEHNYLINVMSASANVTITNGESATMKVIYQLPTEETSYSICFGYLGNSLGCFTKN